MCLIEAEWALWAGSQKAAKATRRHAQFLPEAPESWSINTSYLRSVVSKAGVVRPVGRVLLSPPMAQGAALREGPRKVACILYSTRSVITQLGPEIRAGEPMPGTFLRTLTKENRETLQAQKIVHFQSWSENLKKRSR